jgi:hypothetical protein
MLPASPGSRLLSPFVLGTHVPVLLEPKTTWVADNNLLEPWTCHVLACFLHRLADDELRHLARIVPFQRGDGDSLALILHRVKGSRLAIYDLEVKSSPSWCLDGSAMHTILRHLALSYSVMHALFDDLATLRS